MCISEGRFIFLDLRHNRYFGLTRRKSLLATDVFTGFPKPNDDTIVDSTESGNEETTAILDELSSNGLLAIGNAGGKVAMPTHIRSASEALLSNEHCTNFTVCTRHRIAFVNASLRASLKLRFYSMQRTVRSIQTRKRLRSEQATDDLAALRELIAIFQHLRPLYGRKYLCLFDSLALLEFLAHFDFFPQWVFGVTAEPFNAHCWVQETEYVVNDSVEYVRTFTPIMAV